MTQKGTILLTGATGFVGMELLARYLERSDRDIVALVRAPSDEAATARMDAVLANLFGVRRAASYASRVRAVAAELTASRMGLSDLRYTELAAKVSTIIHSAASVSFSQPLEEAREINREGTRKLLEFAGQARRDGGLERYAHISTAYVAGTHRGRFCERDLDVRQQFRNSYEQSKFEAEQLVRNQAEVPFTILRPSIIVGDRHSGWTSAFNVLYWPLRAFSRGLFYRGSCGHIGPCRRGLGRLRRRCRARAMRIAGRYRRDLSPDGRRERQHDRRDRQRRQQVLQASGPACSRRASSRPARAAQCRPRGARGGAASISRTSSVDTVFDDAATRARLEPRGIRSSPLGDYLERLLDFATRSRWGKLPITRIDALTSWRRREALAT